MPTITYVGRLTDSRKGLEIFLDAIELLLCADLPRFRTWIIGGAPGEAIFIEQAIHRADACCKAFQEGRIEIWRHVERTALPELYSRSTVICIPSLREQFGMVAVEAMMCGTPVVASRVGGLQDIIVDSLTGYLVDRLNPVALAAALSQFIRNHNLKSWMGHNAFLWSRSRFEMCGVAKKYTDLYERLISGAILPEYDDSGPASLRRQMLESNRTMIEHLSGSCLTGVWDVSSSPTPSFIAETNAGKLFIKLHQKRPPSLSCLIGTERKLQRMYDPADRIRLAQFIAAAPVAPKVLSTDEDTGILIQELLLNEPDIPEREAEARMLEASEQIQSLVDVQGTEAERFLQALQAAAATTESDIAVDLVDEAATNLSASILGVKPSLRQCHPQIELMRIDGYLRRNPWAVSLEFGIRARSLIRFLITQRPLMQALPRLQHGSMKREHLMRHTNGSAAVCDLDHAGFYVGPHDLAHWFHDEQARNEAPAPFCMLSHIHRLARTDDDCFLAAIWLVVLPLYNALWRFARGNWSFQFWEMQFMTAYPEAFRKVFTQSKEIAGIRQHPPGI
jgi:hypothetical protein